MTEKVTIEIDGRACEAVPGEMIIEVADREGISIPRFCYHKKLSIAANCRMCLVEAEQGGRPFPKPVPACATPIGAGMKVQTRSPKALEAQKGTMEFLLINHPLDCPICDQGGECELQDVAMGYGGDVSRYGERKRVVADEDFGPLIATDMTRCIHCTRCVRFGAEIAGVRELGATGRGEHLRIGTYVAHTLAHELSGNVIDLCPVGALTSKPYRFTARAWELTQVPGISPHDSLGSNLSLHVRGRRVLRVHPRENEAINETWIADRDRFSYAGLAAPDRLTEPLVKQDGAWQPVSWQKALRLAAERLKAGGAASGALVSPQATLEEMYLAQKLVRGLGANALDTRLRQADFRGNGADPALPWLGLPIAELPGQEGILLIGTDLRQEQPLLAHRLRQAVENGARVACVNPYALSLTFPAVQYAVIPAAMVAELAALARALEVRGTGPLASWLEAARPDARHEATAAWLRQAGNNGRGRILLGALAAAHPDYAPLKALAQALATASGAHLGFLPAAANSLGAHLAGALPHLDVGARPLATPGRDAAAMLASPPKTWLLWGVEPAYDTQDPAALARALAAADFVIAAATHRETSLEACADLLLPIAAFAETSGTFVNLEACWQGFRGAIPPPGEARPGWKVLRVLGNLLDLASFDYNASEEVCAAVRAACADIQPDNRPRGDWAVELRLLPDGQLCRVGPVPIYAGDALVRRAPALQASPLAEELAVVLHPDTAASLGLGTGDRVAIRQNGALVEAPTRLDEAVPAGCARIPAAVAGSEALGPQIGPIALDKV